MISRQLSKNRIEALTDGIYAIALTLAVLTINISEIPITGSGSIVPALKTILPQLIHYAIAFFVLASFWSAHHRQTDAIKKVDNIYAWLSIITLFFVALVPFTTDLIGDYGEYPDAVAVYAGNLFLIGTFSLMAIYHANSKGGLISDEIEREYIDYFIAKSLIVPVICIIIIIFAYTVSATGSTVIFLLIPVFTRILKQIYKKRTNDNT
ncbi:TMEM175 family protein [Methanoplanus endosymbiosus]|uniref:TMEM175 family protein n=1 Tax=Methanoplanus endosymbiosus TaxID=33865 RepID=A0A9E7PK56_9EURY|nr:TMEM175 family protein [Methanoplanus endosymbiosus]UUX91523.1 TMEM175 family protein [Methanoplanus endosymbiosus]